MYCIFMYGHFGFSPTSLKDVMEQKQFGFSDSMLRAGSDKLQKSAESFLSALQLMYISQISTQKYESGHFDPF